MSLDLLSFLKWIQSLAQIFYLYPANSLKEKELEHGLLGGGQSEYKALAKDPA